MDDRRFDALTRTLGTGFSRRQMLSAIGAAVVGALGSTGLATAASCRKADTVCRKAGDCCSGHCSEKDSKGRSYCVCPPGTEICKRDCVDPAIAYASDAKNCGSCGNVCSNSKCGVGVCNAGVCGIGPDSRRVGRSCDDGNLCTTADVCQADGSCVGTPVTCSVTEPKCQFAVCNPSTGQCDITNFTLGTACANDTRCDGDEACDGNGVCATGTPVSCENLDTACATGVCDPETGQCSAQLKPDRTSCLVVVGVESVNGYCCNGLCSQCCGTVDDCPPATEANIDVACIPGITQCSYTCPWAVPLCTNPVVTGGGNGVSCRLEVGSACSEDTQCCGFCVNSICEAGAAGSECLDIGDCASGLFCNTQGICETAIELGGACDPSTSVCATGTSCGQVIGSNVNNFCCLPLDSVCSADADCCQNGGVQERCVLGFCKTRGSSGTACGKDFDCAGALTCIAGTCGTKVGIGGSCDSDSDCVFDQTSNTQPICSGGICGLPNGTPATGPGDCASGTSVQCDYGTVCGECCTTDTTGFDPTFCGDLASEKICCNHTCIFRNDNTHCGACNVDCTCGGTDPYRYCTTVFDSETPSSDWPAICTGTYSASSGHCAGNSDYCSTTCLPAETCDCQQAVSSLFCYAQCVGSFPGIELSICAVGGGDCLPGHDQTCCEDTLTCQTVGHCPPNVIFCLSEDYACAPV